MKPIEFLSQSPQETITFAQGFAKSLKAGDVVCLQGELGAGKTTFVKGLAQALRVESTYVNSPTFVLMNFYEGKLPIYHFDLYRLEDPQALATVNFDEYFYGNGISVIEWAERLGSAKPQEYFLVKLEHRSEFERLIKVSRTP